MKATATLTLIAISLLSFRCGHVVADDMYYLRAEFRTSKLGCGFGNLFGGLTNRFKTKDLTLKSTENTKKCHLNFYEASWHCDAGDTGASDEHIYVVRTKDGPIGLGKLQRVRDADPEQLLEIALATVKADEGTTSCSKRRCIFTRNVGGKKQELRLKVGTVVKGPFNDRVMFHVPLMYKAPPAPVRSRKEYPTLREDAFVHLMVPFEEGVSVMHLKKSDARSDRWRGVSEIAVDRGTKLTETAIAVELHLEKSSWKAKLTFVPANKKVPKKTVAILQAGDGQSLTKKFLRDPVLRINNGPSLTLKLGSVTAVVSEGEVNGRTAKARQIKAVAVHLKGEYDVFCDHLTVAADVAVKNGLADKLWVVWDITANTGNVASIQFGHVERKPKGKRQFELHGPAEWKKAKVDELHTCINEVKKVEKIKVVMRYADNYYELHNFDEQLLQIAVVERLSPNQIYFIVNEKTKSGFVTNVPP